MSYRIEIGEGLAAAFGRIAAEEVALAMAKLRGRNPGLAIHNARKAVKRLRALLLTLRVTFSADPFGAEDGRLAGAGRKLAPLRDVHVQLRALDKLLKKNEDSDGKLRQKLLRRQEKLARKISGLKTEVRDLLLVTRHEIPSWPLDKSTPSTLAAGLKRIYRQGRRAFKTASKHPKSENLHQWRKKVKALASGIALLECLAPKEFSNRMPQCQTLGNVLGKDHDLCMVREILGRTRHARPARAHEEVAQQIDRKRAKLQKQAFKLGKLVYSDKPRCFARDFKKHLGILSAKSQPKQK